MRESARPEHSFRVLGPHGGFKGVDSSLVGSAAGFEIIHGLKVVLRGLGVFGKLYEISHGFRGSLSPLEPCGIGREKSASTHAINFLKGIL